VDQLYILLENCLRYATHPLCSTQRLTLSIDYIYVTTSKDNPPVPMGYLQAPTTEQLQPGIPMKGVTGSDHVSLTVDVAWK
jgi:hypothetical protein